MVVKACHSVLSMVSSIARSAFSPFAYQIPCAGKVHCRSAIETLSR